MSGSPWYILPSVTMKSCLTLPTTQWRVSDRAIAHRSSCSPRKRASSCPERLAHTDDDEKPETLLDAILTIPPLTEWPPDCREKLWETCKFVISLSRDLKQMTETGDSGGD